MSALRPGLEVVRLMLLLKQFEQHLAQMQMHN